MSMSVEDAKRNFLFADTALANATRICGERAKAYAEVAPIIDAYKTAVENENYWRSEYDAAQKVLFEALRAEASDNAA